MTMSVVFPSFPRQDNAATASASLGCKAFALGFDASYGTTKEHGKGVQRLVGGLHYQEGKNSFAGLWCVAK